MRSDCSVLFEGLDSAILESAYEVVPVADGLLAKKTPGG